MRVLEHLNRMFSGFSDFVVHPIVGWMAVVGLAAGLLLPATGLGLSSCSMKASTGIPCPGCGLTRSVTCTLQGRPLWAFHYNPFGIAIAGGLVLFAPVAFLPKRRREQIAARLQRIEGLIAVLGIAFVALLVAHGLLRGALIYMDHPAYRWWQNDVPPPFVTGQTHHEAEATPPAVSEPTT